MPIVQLIELTCRGYPQLADSSAAAVHIRIHSCYSSSAPVTRDSNISYQKLITLSRVLQQKRVLLLRTVLTKHSNMKAGTVGVLFGHCANEDASSLLLQLLLLFPALLLSFR